MKKRLYLAALTAALTLGAAATAYAAQWVPDTNGWWYQEDDGSWPANTWKWIDGNQDGVAECYYFGPNGYIYTSTATPDGYTVDGNGAWTVNGAVQTQTTGGNTFGGSQSVSQTAELNRRAVAAYREKILEYMSNPIPIIDDWEYVSDSFRVMDMNGDGIFEAMINFAGPLGRGIRRTDFLYYTDHLCSETIPSGMSHGDYYFYNPSSHLLMTYGFSEGPHFFYAYQYNGQTLEDVDSWTVNVDSGSADGPIGWRGSDSPDHVESVLEWLKNSDEGAFELISVPVNEEMLDTYLSGDGKATPVQQSDLYETIYEDVYSL